MNINCLQQHSLHKQFKLKRTAFYSAGNKTELVLNVLNSRIIHLDVVHDIITTSFLNCFRRFIAVRGSPKTVYFRQCNAIQSCKQGVKSTMEQTNNRLRSTCLLLTNKFVFPAEIVKSFGSNEKPFCGVYGEDLCY